MPKQSITKYTDRYIGKKVGVYLNENNYKNVKLYYSTTDTIGKNIIQRLNIFQNSISFRSTKGKENISEDISAKMDDLLFKLKKKFEKDNFYYTMTVLYYIAHK